MRILTVVGNRPQFIKAAAVSGPLRERHEELLVHTGQHYDDSLSRVFFGELGLAAPRPRAGHRRRLEHLADRAHARARSSRCSREVAPDAVLVYGDTNSTLAGALAAAQAGVPVVHVEAGMRSFDRTMPEELNRVLTDHLATCCCAPRRPPRRTCGAESVAGRDRGRRRRDGRRRAAPAAARARGRRARSRAYGVEPGAYLLLTAHRAGNVDDPARLRALVELLRGAAGAGPVRRCTRARARACSDAGLLERAGGDSRA